MKLISYLHAKRSALAFGGFMVVQALLLALAVVALAESATPPLWYQGGVAVLAVVSVAVDVPLFLRLDRFHHRARQAQRVEILQHELDHYLQQYEAVEREIRLVGRLRHDLRNQSNVAMLLARQGDVERAQQHLDMLIDEIIRRSMELEPTEGEDLRHLGGCPAVAPGERRAAEDGSPESEKRPMGGGLMAMRHSTGRRVLAEVVAFPLSQLVALLLLFSYAAACSATLAQWIVLGAVAALCPAVDVVLIRVIAEATRHQLIDERVRILEEQKDVQHQQYQRLVDELDEARRVRRDIVEALAESRTYLARAEVPEALASMERAVDLSGGSHESYCENRAVNALIMMKMRRCAEEHIEATCTVVVPERLHILDVDLCAAFSNLLDNAINGCAAAPAGQRRLEVRACLVAGVMMIDVRNTTDAAADVEGPAGSTEPEATGEAAPARRHATPAGRRGKDRPWPSTLARRHGWGLQILEVLAIRYNGTFECGREGADGFRATLMLMNEAGGGALWAEARTTGLRWLGSRVLRRCERRPPGA